MNESQTKHDFIDPALKEAGWGVVEGSRVRLEFPITQGRLIGQGRRSTPLFADYVLQYKNRNLAVIEAKARDLHYTEGVAQAKDYAERLNIRFTYATNGLQIYGMDMEQGKEGEIDEGHEYTEQEFNRIIEIQGREEFRVKRLMELINQNQKTLVFCATQKHAAAVRNLINQYADSSSPNYCHRVTADDAKLADLLVLKYHALADAKHQLGNIKSIRHTFVGFQSHLYEAVAA